MCCVTDTGRLYYWGQTQFALESGRKVKNTDTDTDTDTYTYRYRYRYIHIHIHIHTYTYTYTYTHPCIQTQRDIHIDSDH